MSARARRRADRALLRARSLLFARPAAVWSERCGVAAGVDWVPEPRHRAV